MLIISYNLSPTLKERMAKTEALRKKILLLPASPHTELILRWQTTLDHLSGWALLSNQPSTKNDIQSIILNTHSYSTTSFQTKVLNYKKALNYVYQEWPANPESVTVNTILDLAKILSVNYGSEKEIESLLTYLQAKDMDPIIQAAVSHLFFYPNRLCYLVSLLFLTKHGYDLRGWLNLEEYWNQDKDRYLKMVQEAAQSATITRWLEYYCQAMIDQMEKIASFLSSSPQTLHSIPRTFWRLTDRQKAIIDILGQPGSTITNKTVQSRFEVSHVTASRELSKLSSLGLIFPHGSGRSIYYTRV